MALPCADSRHWNIAECSESTGRIGAWYFLDISITIEPAATRVSLLARAMTFPAQIAAIVGASPLNPTIAATTMSTLSLVTRSQTDFIPANTFVSVPSNASARSLYLVSSQMTALLASNSLAWLAISSQLPLQVSISTSKRSLCSLITSRVCLPIEPVEPSIAILLLSIRNLYIWLDPRPRPCARARNEDDPRRRAIRCRREWL